MQLVKPMVGQWYLSRDTDRMFEVVSVDDASGAVELQDYDGSLYEVDSANWFALDVEAIEPPDDLDGIDMADADVVDVEKDREDLQFQRTSPGLRAVWQSEFSSHDW